MAQLKGVGSQNGLHRNVLHDGGRTGLVLHHEGCFTGVGQGPKKTLVWLA